MTTLGKMQGSSAAEPRIALWTQVKGYVRDVEELTFQIVLKDDDSQVYPEAPGEKAAATKIATGRYVAVWAGAGEDGDTGLYEVRWFMTIDEGDAEVSFSEDFEVIAAAPRTSPGYGFVADVRAEGITSAQANDARVLSALHLASRDIERATGRRFKPEGRTVRLDGRDSPALLLGEPVIGISSIVVERRAGSGGAGVDLTVDIEDVEVFNRHLQGLVSPDDREAPKLSFYRAADYLPAELDSLRAGWLGGTWPFGQGNCVVTGVFGYTDPDGANPQGVTPFPVRRAAMLLALRTIYPVGSADFEDARGRHLLTSERTRDQGYSRLVAANHPALVGDGLTGDPEIDAVLASYTAPLGMGAA